MSKETERFLKAEQAAEELVEALKKLRDEAVTYKASTEQLDAVRTRLITFIEASQRISQDTKTAVELLKSIGGPEILGSLNVLDGKVMGVDSELKSTFEKLTKAIAKELDEIKVRVDKLQKLILVSLGIASLSFVLVVVILATK